jgi:hypothetical protein
MLRINCSYKLWIVNKTNYQSERRLQAPIRGTLLCIYFKVYVLIFMAFHKIG